ncbi:MAG: hypothetical protein U9R50_09860 [Campylobacterota bacterium]|nr:hypothetical protein [Campylobacterota bacterium]
MNFEEYWIFDSLFVFYAVHAVVSALIAFIASFFLLKRFEDNKHLFIGFVFLFNIAMPGVGYLFTIWVIYYLLSVQYDKLLNNVSYINMIEFETEFPEIQRIFGEGSMSDLLSNGLAPTSLKMKALVSMADNITQKNLSLIKNSLSDKDDEIRLYSFAIIDKIERGINKSIHQKLNSFQENSENMSNIDSKDITEKEREEYIKLAEELTYLYWDMVYFELSDEDLKKYILQEVKRYAKIVLNAHLNHIGINVLLGKVYLMEKEYENASTCFAVAIENENETGFTHPYLAEIFFNQKNYRSTKSLLSNAKILQMNGTLYPVVEQWKSA